MVVGSSNTDMVIRVGHLPRAGETVLGGEFLTAAGGKGANQAVGAARAGGRVTFIARVGRDELGKHALAGLRRHGIGVNRVVRDPRAPSGVALIFVAADGENSIGVAGGANANLRAADVRRAAGSIQAADIVMAQLETPLSAVRAAADLASRAGVRMILNPAPARPLPDALLARVAVLTPNETEAEILTGVRISGVSGAARACAALRRRGARTVILTLGARGAFIATKGLEMRVPGFKVEAVDTTAAGDIFNGALAVALGEGRELPEAVRFANAAAALSVTRRGAQSSAPSRAAIERLLQRRVH